VTRCDDLRTELGAYALGGLEPAEHDEVERHLSACPACRAALDELAPLTRLLDLVDPAAPLDEASPPRLERSILARYAAEHRPPPRERRAARRPRARPRWQIAVPSALAGAAVALAVLAVTGALSARGPGGGEVELAARDGGDARATARLAAGPSGTAIELEATLPPLRAGEIYELWFVRGDGRVSAGTFTVGVDGRADLRLATSADVSSYDRIGITREPDGVDPARNGPSVVVGALAAARSAPPS
jgi:hypothetical protein